MKKFIPISIIIILLISFIPCTVQAGNYVNFDGNYPTGAAFCDIGSQTCYITGAGQANLVSYSTPVHGHVVLYISNFSGNGGGRIIFYTSSSVVKLDQEILSNGYVEVYDIDLSDPIQYIYIGAYSTQLTITLSLYGDLPATPTPTITLTSTITTTPEPIMPDSFICDGSMEMDKEESLRRCWAQAQVSYTTIDEMGPTHHNYEFGRSILSPIWPLSWLDSLANGPAACGNGFQAVGWFNPSLTYWNGGLASAIVQRFFKFSGGTLYYKLRARGKYFGLVPPPEGYQSHGNAYIMNQWGAKTYLLDNMALNSNWTFYNGSISLSPGVYFLELSRSDYTDISINGDTVYYDDVELGNEPFTDTCTDESQGTPTPAVTNTGTANPQTQTALASRTTTNTPGGPELPTNTPGPSGTPPPRSIWITNCGFEAGSNGWAFNSQSYIALAGGPTGPQYAVAVKPDPSVSQTFDVSDAGIVYFMGFAKGSIVIKTHNNTTGAEMVWYSGDLANWTQLSLYKSMTPGNYRIELDSGSNSQAGNYDGINMRWGAWPVTSWCMNTPTAGPTAYLTPTPTTPHATKTNTPTLSPYPTGTHYPTWTATPLGTPDRGGWYTNTPGPTETAFMATATSLVATATSYAQTEIAGMTTTPGYVTGIPPWSSTGTPDLSLTPGPGGWMPPIQPGPGGNPANCLRPDNALNLAWWADYEVCRVMGFVSWSSDNSATVVAVPIMFADKEPFGSIGEVASGLNVASTQVAIYDWGNSGISGVNQQVNPSAPLNNLGISGDPWAPGWSVDLTPGGAGSGWNGYSRYCSTQLTDILSARLSEGLCYALTITRQVGILPWVQFIINMLCIFGIVRVILQTIRFYAAFPSSAPTAGAVQTKGNMK